MIRIRSHLATLLLSLLSPFAAALPAHGDLEYGVVYRGVFSMGADMQIADVVLASARPRDAELGETRLEASSAAYPLVESLYPIRYRFRTWVDPDGDLVAFETYEKTSKLRHRLYLRDESRLGVKRLDLTQPGQGDGEIAQLDAGRRPPQAARLPASLSDRLGLLQRVRAQALDAGNEYRFEVTNGSKRFDYRVRVEKAETLQVGAVAVPAWKVRFDGSRVKGNGEVKQAHLPLYVWLSRSGGHVPLRVDSRHAIGLFRVELKDPGRLPQIAGL